MQKTIVSPKGYRDATNAAWEEQEECFNCGTLLPMGISGLCVDCQEEEEAIAFGMQSSFHFEEGYYLY